QVRREAIDLRGTDEVVLGEAVDGRGRVADHAATVVDRELGMVPLGRGDPGDRVHERDGPAEGGKAEASLDALAVGRERPLGVEGRHELASRRKRQRLDAAFTRLAAPFVQVAHAMEFRWGVAKVDCSVPHASEKKAGPEGPARRARNGLRAGQFGLAASSGPSSTYSVTATLRWSA